MNSNHIPRVASIEELSRFWQNHDLTDFENDLEEVAEPAFRRETVVKLRLPAVEADALERIATARGIKPIELIQEWIAERVRTGA